MLPSRVLSTGGGGGGGPRGRLGQRGKNTPIGGRVDVRFAVYGRRCAGDVFRGGCIGGGSGG